MTKISKAHAASRLITSAVKMISRNDDPAAIHVVATAALTILREIMSVKGESYTYRTLRVGLFEIANERLGRRLRHGGVLPEPVSMFVDAIADEITAGRITKAEDINLPAGLKDHDFLHYLIKPFNFLKHADRDSEEYLDEEDLKPEEATVGAIGAYSILFASEPLPLEVVNFLGSKIGWKPPGLADARAS